MGNKQSNSIIKIDQPQEPLEKEITDDFLQCKKCGRLIFKELEVMVCTQRLYKPFTDKDGKVHYHDGNICKKTIGCGFCGTVNEERVCNQCSSCDWNSCS